MSTEKTDPKNIVKRRDYEDKIEDFAEIYDLIEQKLIEAGVADPSEEHVMCAMEQVLMAFSASECKEQYDLDQQQHEMDEPLEPIEKTPPSGPERRAGPNSQKFFFSHNSTPIETAHNGDIYEVESGELPFNRGIHRTR